MLWYSNGVIHQQDNTVTSQLRPLWWPWWPSDRLICFLKVASNMPSTHLLTCLYMLSSFNCIHTHIGIVNISKWKWKKCDISLRWFLTVILDVYFCAHEFAFHQRRAVFYRTHRFWGDFFSVLSWLVCSLHFISSENSVELRLSNYVQFQLLRASPAITMEMFKMWCERDGRHRKW